MARTLTEQENFAKVLAGLVSQRCTESRRPKTSRTGLQSLVPVQERPYVRRGLDALIEHGVLATAGEDIGLAPKGVAFMAFVAGVEQQSPTVEADVKGHGVLQPLLAAIAQDERLAPPKPVDEIRTLPARLEPFKPARKSGVINKWTIALGATAAVGVLILFR
ncbi:MAG: hypothetical protein KJ832_23580 [Gammaproteobacteria bacterium]|nr:hypothetical protein [Gammaproteobacteria bacterium]